MGAKGASDPTHNGLEEAVGIQGALFLPAGEFGGLEMTLLLPTLGH